MVVKVWRLYTSMKVVAPQGNIYVSPVELCKYFLWQFQTIGFLSQKWFFTFSKAEWREVETVVTANPCVPIGASFTNTELEAEQTWQMLSLFVFFFNVAINFINILHWTFLLVT